MAYTMVIADDNPVIIEGIQHLVEMRFADLMIIGSYKNGQDLIRDLESGALSVPDILVSDIRMPLADGIAVCKYLKGSGAPTRIILITAYKDFEYARSALNLGVNQLIVKPFTSEDLLSGIAENLDAVRAENTPIPENLPDPQSLEHRFSVESIKKYVNANLSNDALTVQAIAAHFNLSSNYLSYLFSKKAGMTLSKYISSTRIEYAKWLLRTKPHMTIVEVAKASGFSSVGYFNNVFKKVLGTTPLKYKMK